MVEDLQGWLGQKEEQNLSAPVKHFTHELSIRGRLRRLLIKNPTTRLCSTVFDVCVKCLVCILYVTRVCLDDHKQFSCYGEICPSNINKSTPVSEGFSSTNIHWHVLLWVHRPLALWLVQVILAVITLVKASLQVYCHTKGTRLENLLFDGFLMEVACSFPVILTCCYPVLLQNMYLPVFMNCWLGRGALARLFNDLHLRKQRFQTISVTLSQQMMLLNITLLCLVFTTICGIQHIQRGSDETSLTMFESLYFVIVTFSTVGYGDISPDIWLGQLFMFVMIIVAFAFIPRQLEEIGSTWIQQKKSGGEYKKGESPRHRHVVVCMRFPNTEMVMNFLNEFYAHPKLEQHTVVLISPNELENDMQMILKDPKWANRVVYIRGSALKDVDLKRCRINQADACFFLAPKNTGDRNKAMKGGGAGKKGAHNVLGSERDQHTILRSWAVKDFAPQCRQYLQLFKAENKMHVKFAEHVVCEDEFKYALLANNCLYPGLSTLVTLLLHTSRGREGEVANEPWQQIYGRHSGMEVYHIQLNKSSFFRKFEGKKFTEASVVAHQRYGVCLVAVLDVNRSEPRLQLNPGSDHILKGSDFCFYLGMTREEYSKINACAETEAVDSARTKNIELIASEIQKWLQSEEEGDVDDDESLFSTITSQLGKTITHRLQHNNDVSTPLLSSPVEKDTIKKPVSSSTAAKGTETLERFSQQESGKILQFYDMGQESFITGPPPSTLYVGTKRTSCHLHRDRRPSCCTKWGEVCEHCSFKTAKDERWDQQLIILVAGYGSTGIYNFIVPLRSDYLNVNNLSPIILLLEQEPDKMFIETIAHFPLVYWMQGKMTSIDDLLVAGINKATHLVVANKENDSDIQEDVLSDAETVVTVQKITNLFPATNVITELNDASNMRFMQFQAHDAYSQSISKLEKRLKEETNSNLPHLFRLPFTSGQVFSAGMLDRLLYQTFVKGYLISFVRLLLGIDAEPNSGHLSSVRVRRATLAQFPTYNDLYQGLCSTTGEIPIAIYRTEKRPALSVAALEKMDNEEVLVNNNSKHFGLPSRPSIPAKLFAQSDTDFNRPSELVYSRMKSLDLSDDIHCDTPLDSNILSYVIVNPSPKRKLKSGDMIYVIQPSSMFAVPNKLKWRSPKMHRKNFVVSPASTPVLARTTRISWNLSPDQRKNSANSSSTSAVKGEGEGRSRSKSESQVNQSK
ncbi:hypothetical protein LOTGIDRAFT_232492 [Lottia gigantea]|uniref:Calcium-activated potassium channel BK alpha subunit domain-containing protein n=1 Tax=Lottia gigantea TaxID=225164 RepID=V4AGF6_LOTGI|nr:hypothetical protein LOTGIDRAFT_232492 [Lottia gigantea]ESO94250.1 hypothetical protein LOTGIDRAFT_232492 [Lottia gigantea]